MCCWPYLQSLLSGLNGGDVAGHTASDDDQVLLLCECRSVGGFELGQPNNGADGAEVEQGQHEPAADANERLHLDARAGEVTAGRLTSRRR